MQQNQVRRKSGGQTEMTVAVVWLGGKSHHEKTKKERERGYTNTPIQKEKSESSSKAKRKRIA